MLMDKQQRPVDVNETEVFEGGGFGPAQTILLNDMSRVSQQLPDNVKIGIADAIVAFSYLEHAAERLTSQLHSSSIDDGFTLPAPDARLDFHLLKQMVASHGLMLAHPPLPENFWETLDDLRRYRDQVARDQWAMVDGEIPVTASFWFVDQEVDAIIAHAFSIERLEAIASECKRCFHHLARLGLAHRTQPSRADLQRP
jgi:hypothetical protein